MGRARTAQKGSEIPSLRHKITRELELVCGINCSRIVDRALRAAAIEEVPQSENELRTFVYVHLKNQLLQHYQEEAIASRLCEVVAAATHQDTGMVRLPTKRTSERKRQPSREEIRPPVRMSLSPSATKSSLADIVAVCGRKPR